MGKSFRGVLFGLGSLSVLVGKSGVLAVAFIGPIIASI